MEENHKDTAADGTSEGSNSTERDLVSGVVDDIVLGEIIPRLSRATPWEKRPVLSLLSRTWANAMASQSQSPLLYDRVYNPSARLSSHEFIVSRAIPSSNHGLLHDADCAVFVWVWDPFRGTKSTLPQPPIPRSLTRFHTKFVCDGERVYALSYVIPLILTGDENVDSDMYHVWMLNLREFNIRWKELPSLPILGKHVYASTCAGQSYLWQRRRTLSSEANGWKLSGSGENDSKWHWEHINVNTPPPQNMNFDKSNRLPLYIEITVYNEMTQASNKFLYARCPRPRHILNFRTEDEPFPFLEADSDYRRSIVYIFMFPDVDGDIYGGGLYYFHVDTNIYDGLCILKMELNNENTRIVEEGQWDDFVNDWEQNEQEEDNNYPKLPSHAQGISSAIKVSQSTSSGKMENWKDTLLKMENWTDMSLYKFSRFMVVQNGPMYGYKLMRGKL